MLCRRYRYTFRDGGFYQSLKKKAKKILTENPTGEEWKSKYAVSNFVLEKSISAKYLFRA